MRIVNLNPDAAIGATSWFIEAEGHAMLLDAGTHPKRDGNAALPLYDRVRDEDVDAIAISHCHHDHVGSLPVALRHFPKAHVLMTELSYFIVERVLHNSVNVMVKQRDDLGIQEYPLYSHREVDDLAPIFQGFRYHREVEWAGFQKTRAGVHSPTLEFFDAGHALGSAGVMVRWGKQTLFYTGDVCFQDQTILRGARFDDITADVLILETTRGNREIPEGFSRDQEAARLATSLEEVMGQKGCVLIPTFALGRTQEILAQLALMMQEGRLREQPVYIGGLGRVFTEIYDLQAHRAHRNHSNLILNEALNLVVLDRRQVDQIKLKGARLFVLTAGMMTENTAAHEIAMRMVQDERHAIFFVGYADPDTPAGRLRAAADGASFQFSPSAGELTRKCRLEEFDLTAHANRDELVDFVGRVSPKTVVLGHGEEESIEWMREAIQARHPKVRIVSPGPGESLTV